LNKYLLASAVLGMCVSTVALAADVPKEMAKFIQRRESCDRWRGEDGYNKKRQADINRAICQACTGTDAELKRLKRKFKNRPDIQARLNNFEPQIEEQDKAKTRRFCKTTKKPT
jgi:hypothetical protein